MNRFLVSLVALTSSVALGQGTPPIEPQIQPKVIVVPYPSEVYDAGSPVVSQPFTQPELAPPPTPQQDAPMPPSEPLPDRSFQATPPPPEPQPINPEALPQPVQGPGAFLDGHPREGAFLSGPGSLAFIMHHTLMTGFGVLTTQMLPRINDAYCYGQPSCTVDSTRWTSSDARVAYLAGGLVGAGVGFGASAAWQFTHWMSNSTAYFGMVNSFFGGAFAGSVTDLISNHSSPTAISWITLIGALAGAWLTPIVGGGDLAVNKGVLITSGGAWAMIYTGLIMAIIGNSGGALDARVALDVVMLMPAIGAAALALASLRFNPSTTQIMRANLFGVGAGAAVLLISALVLGANFGSFIPYLLAGIAAAGAKITVSLLWAEAAESPSRQPGMAYEPTSETEKRARVLYW